MNESFVFYKSWIDVIDVLEELPDGLLLEAQDAIISCGITGQMPEHLCRSGEKR